MRRPTYGRDRGPIPKFTDYHVWKALMSFDEREPLGRKKLSRDLGIGEGSTRTILEMLVDAGYVETGNRGTVLTEKGAEAKGAAYMETAPLQDTRITIGQCDHAAIVPGMAKRVVFGCEERDAAILAGATGATTLVCSGGDLTFPGSDFPVDAKLKESLFASFDIRDGDAIVIGTGKTGDKAERGAVAAALSLMGGIPMPVASDDVASGAAEELVSLAFAVHDLVGGLPVCAKSRGNLGIRIEDGAVIDNAYTGDVLEEVIDRGTTVRRVALSGPYEGIRVIVVPIELGGAVVASVGVVDTRPSAGRGDGGIVEF